MIYKFSFQKQEVEKQALTLLKKHDPDKYSEAVLKDRPDIQNLHNSIGVEVVTADFIDNVMISKLQGIPLLQFIRMTKCKSINVNKIKNLINHNPRIFELLLEERPYFEFKGEAIPLLKIESLYNMKNNQLLYLTSYSKFYFQLDDKGNVKLVVPPAQWVGNLSKIMMSRFQEKNIKAITYKDFNEMKLYIHTLMADIEEIYDFKVLLKLNILVEESNYNNVYVLNNWGKKELIEIKLKDKEI